MFNIVKLTAILENPISNKQLLPLPDSVVINKKEEWEFWIATGITENTNIWSSGMDLD